MPDILHLIIANLQTSYVTLVRLTKMASAVYVRGIGGFSQCMQTFVITFFALKVFISFQVTSLGGDIISELIHRISPLSIHRLCTELC